MRLGWEQGSGGRRGPGPHLLQETQLLQLPLVVQDEAVAPWPPARQVLLAADVGHGHPAAGSDPAGVLRMEEEPGSAVLKLRQGPPRQVPGDTAPGT